MLHTCIMAVRYDFSRRAATIVATQVSSTCPMTPQGAARMVLVSFRRRWQSKLNVSVNKNQAVVRSLSGRPHGVLLLAVDAYIAASLDSEVFCLWLLGAHTLVNHHKFG